MRQHIFHSIVGGFVAVLLASGSAAYAADEPVLLAEYTFEAAEQSASEVEDQVGPALSHGKPRGEGEVSLGSLMDSIALDVAGNGDNAIDLGRGADDEFDTMLTAGLHVQVDIQLNENFDRGTIAALHQPSAGNGAWTLFVFPREGTTSNTARVCLMLMDEDQQSHMLMGMPLEAGVPYRVVAQWNPYQDGMAVIEVYDISGGHPLLAHSVGRNVAISRLNDPPEHVGVHIGSRSNGIIPLDGVVDNVRFSHFTEPDSDSQ